MIINRIQNKKIIITNYFYFQQNWYSFIFDIFIFWNSKIQCNIFVFSRTTKSSLCRKFFSKNNLFIYWTFATKKLYHLHELLIKIWLPHVYATINIKVSIKIIIISVLFNPWNISVSYYVTKHSSIRSKSRNSWFIFI